VRSASTFLLLRVPFAVKSPWLIDGGGARIIARAMRVVVSAGIARQHD
jgi:hypothetical protein